MIELYKEVEEGEDNEGVSCAFFSLFFIFRFIFVWTNMIELFKEVDD